MSITVRELLETAIYNVETGGINLKMGIDQLREVWHEIDVLDKELNDDCEMIDQHPRLPSAAHSRMTLAALSKQVVGGVSRECEWRQENDETIRDAQGVACKERS